ncbi:MAG: hypothetical protein AAF663_02045, partial [Planctomycetota bacterium]
PNFLTPAVRADNILVQLGGEIVASAGGFVLSDNGFTIDNGGALRGQGTYVVDDGGGLFNAGTIAVQRAGSGGTDPSLRVQANGDAELDLDGLFELNGVATGRILADYDDPTSTAASEVVIAGPLRDAFSGYARIGRSDTLRFDEPWTLDGTVQLDAGTGRIIGVATLEGAAITVEAPPPGGPATVWPEGLIQVMPNTYAVIDAPLTMNVGTLRLEDSAVVEFAQDATIGTTAQLRLDSFFDQVVVRAGVTLDILQNSRFDLDGNSGTSASVLVGQGATLRIDPIIDDPFNGTLALDEDSTLTLNGLGRFADDAQVFMSQPGLTWNIGGAVTFENDLDFDGVASDGNPFEGFLQLNITDDEARLTLNGDLDPDGTSVDFFRGDIVTSGTLEVERPGNPNWALTQGATLALVPEPLGGGIGTVPDNPRVAGDNLDNGGMITGQGEFDTTVTNFTGTISPQREGVGGAPLPGFFEFLNNKNLVLEEQGRLIMDLAGTVPGIQHDYIRAGAVVTGGTLELNLILGYEPALYTDVLTILEADVNDVDLVFHRVEGVLLGGDLAGTALAVTYLSDAAQVRRALVGDANLNGQIEQGDLNAVLNNWGSNNAGQAFPTVSWATGDLNGDGFVGQADLNAVLNNWGSSAAPSFEGFAVPEPGFTGMLALCGLASLRSRLNW